jgi:Bacterial membrane protein YfhO
MSALGVEPTLESEPPSHDVTPSRRWLFELVGVGWVIAAAVAVMLPALLHGRSLGPYDFLWRYGLSKQPGVPTGFVGSKAGDQISQFIPWSTLAWKQVHQGHLPLWNPYSALGTPLAFNWQSATFSIPALVGYVFPLSLAYTVQVLTTLAVAGTGAYVFARTLKLGVLPGALAGTVFELSGAFLLYLGWPIASVISMTGWLFAAVVLIARGGHRPRHIAYFAIALAFTIYAGQPDALAIVALATAVFAAVLFILRLPVFGRSDPILVPLVDLGVATVAGVALAAPLVLPGVQIAASSVRSVGRGVGGLAATFDVGNLVSLPFAGTSGHIVTGESAYLGAIVVVLAVAAIGLRLRQPIVIAIICVMVLMGAIAFIGPFDTALNAIPAFHAFRWPRALAIMIFSIAVLAAMGMDLLVRSVPKRPVLAWLGTGFLVAGVALVLVWTGGSSQPPVKLSKRNGNLTWAAVEIAVGLLGIGLLVLVKRRRADTGLRNSGYMQVMVGTALLACATAFLVVAGGPRWPSSPSFIIATPAETALQGAVGSSLVGYGIPYPPSARLGIRQDVNVIFGIHEMAVIDPLLPLAYFRSWNTVTGKPAKSAGYPQNSTYSPPFTSARIARTYGVGFVLDEVGHPGPHGGVFDLKIGNEDLYRIPRTGSATVTSIAASGVNPPVTVPGTAIPVSHSGPASWIIQTDSKRRQELRLHLTDVPGWHATIDGQPLRLSTFADVMLQARVPPGRHTIRLHYWPDSFSTGIVLSAVAIVTLLAAVVVEEIRSRRRPGLDNSTETPTRS